MTRSRGINKPRTIWNKAQLQRLVEAYPQTNTEILAAELGLPPLVVYGKANRMGLKKTYEYRVMHAGYIQKGQHISPKTEFKKGLTPWNKGSKGLVTGGVKTQFKKGSIPKNTKQIGDEVTDRDGYVKRKVSMIGNSRQRWRYVHVMNWEALHGPVPKGYCLQFVDGDKSNTAAENLRLVTFAENMKRNSLYNYPEDIQHAIKLRGAINRRINNLERASNE